MWTFYPRKFLTWTLCHTEIMSHVINLYKDITSLELKIGIFIAKIYWYVTILLTDL